MLCISRHENQFKSKRPDPLCLLKAKSGKPLTVANTTTTSTSVDENDDGCVYGERMVDLCWPHATRVWAKSSSRDACYTSRTLAQPMTARVVSFVPRTLTDLVLIVHVNFPTHEAPTTVLARVHRLRTFWPTCHFYMHSFLSCLLQCSVQHCRVC